MCFFSGMRSLLALVCIGFIANLLIEPVQSRKIKSWPQPQSCGTQSNDFTPDVSHNANSWVDPQLLACDRLCAERCYALKFNATVLNACEWMPYCNTNGAPCEVKVFIRTAPCNMCRDGFEFNEETFSENDTTVTLIGAVSLCEISQYLVFVGPNDQLVNTLFNGCTTTAPPQFSEMAVEDADEEFSTIIVDDCYSSSTVGAKSTFVFDRYLGKPNWPMPTFWNNHFVPELLTEFSGQLESTLQVFKPPFGGPVWLEYPYTLPLQPVSCRSYDAALAALQDEDDDT